MVGTKVVRRAAGVAIAGCLIVGMGAPSGSAASRPATQAGTRVAPTAASAHLSMQFYDLLGRTHVVSSGHNHLTLTVDADNSRGGTATDRPRTAGGRSVDLNIQVVTRHNAQSDSWDFPLPGAVFIANPKKGTGHLVTKSKIKPYGAIHLVIKPVGKLNTQSTCPEQRQTSRVVQLRGQFLFNTAPGVAHSWGKVGSRRHTFSLRAALTARYSKPNDDPNCFVPTRQPCPSAVTADYFSQNQSDGSSMSFIAYPHGTSEGLEGSLDVALRKPQGAQRVDQVVTKADPATITPLDPGGSVTITANGPGAAGSATFNAPGNPTSYSADYCKHPSTENSYSGALAADPTLRFRSHLGGEFGVPDGEGSATFFTYQRTTSQQDVR